MMGDWNPTIPRLIHALGWSLLHFLWQGAFLSALLFGLMLVLRRQSPAVRYSVACATLVLMALCPLLTIAVVLGSPDQAPASSESASARSTHGVATSAGLTAAQVSRAPQILPSMVRSRRPDGPSRSFHRLALSTPLLARVVLLWICGVVVLSIRLIAGMVGLSRLRRRNTRPVSPALQRRLQELAQCMGLHRTVLLFESSSVTVPTVVGGLRNVILVPISALTGLPTSQLEAILAHELAHIRRRDSLVNLVQVVIETVLFYHPGIWWVSHRIRVEREHCCDDLAVRTLGDRITYARALTALEELRSVPGPLVLAANGGDLLSRIRYVLGRCSTTFTPTPATSVGVVSMLLCTALGIAALRPAQSSPQSTQQGRSAGTTDRKSAGTGSLQEPSTPGSGTSEMTGPVRPQSSNNVVLAGSSGSPRNAAACQTVASPASPQSPSPHGSDTARDAEQSDDPIVRDDAEVQGSAHHDGSGIEIDDAQIGEQIQRALKGIKVEAEVRRALRDAKGGLNRESKAQILAAMQQVTRALRDAHLGQQIEQAMRQVDVDKQLEQALRGAKLQEQVQRAVESGKLSEQIQRALSDAHLDEQVQRALRESGRVAQAKQKAKEVHVQVQRALKALKEAQIDKQMAQGLREAHIDQQMRRALKDAHVGEQVQKALKDAHLEERIDGALKQAAEEVQRALQEVDKQDRPGKESKGDSETPPP